MYIVWLREHVVTRSRVYKVGQSGNVFARIKGYPKGSRLLFFVEWDNDESVGLAVLETVVLCMLRGSPEVKQRRDLGSEYFECDMDLIISVILDVRKRLKFAPDGEGWDEMFADSVSAVESESASSTMEADDPTPFGAEGDNRGPLVEQTTDEAVKGFLKEQEAELAGATVEQSELFLMFNAYVVSTGRPLSCARPTPRSFSRTLAALSGAKSVMVKDGLVEQRHVKFPVLDTSVELFVGECIRRQDGGLITLQQAKNAYKMSSHFDGRLKSLKADLEKALRTVCLDHKRGPNGSRLRYVFEGFALVAKEDCLSTFIKLRCSISADETVSAMTFVVSLNSWCRSQGEPMFSKQNLPKDMEAKGFPSRKKRVAGLRNPVACYFGIALLPDNDSDDDGEY